MTEIRPITKYDVAAVAGFATRILRMVSADDSLHVDEKKVTNSVAFFAKDQTNTQHFQLAAFHDRLCVGAIAAFTAEMAYFERQEAHVMLWHATRVGVGMQLAQRMMAWVRSEPRIRRVTWNMNTDDMGARMARVLDRRLGFRPYSSMLWTK